MPSTPVRRVEPRPARGSLDTWRVCGRPVDDLADNHGCVCGPRNPTRYRAERALERLNGTGEEPRGA